MPKLIGVVAATPRGIIGRQGALPWKLSSDLRRFKRTTMGGVLLMGRRTYESIGSPLPGRTTVVVTGDQQWTPDGIEVIRGPTRDTTLQAAIARASEIAEEIGNHIYVVGGAELYRQVMARCDEWWWTTVWTDVGGDTSLAYPAAYRCTESVYTPAGPNDAFGTTCMKLVRPTS